MLITADLGALTALSTFMTPNTGMKNDVLVRICVSPVGHGMKPH